MNIVKLRITGVGLAFAALASTAHPAFAGEVGTVTPAAAPPAAVAAKPGPATSFVPESFTAPILVEAAGFKLVPLGPDVVKLDFAAYMSSVEHLQKTFSRSTRWPRAGITDADAMRDMQGEQARFSSRRSFSYAVLTPDGTRERGSVYVQPSPVGGYDAVVKMWVTKADYDAGFDAELYNWVTGWIQKEWPFKKVAYPGRAIEWATWDAMVAANKPAAVVPQ
jgi:hypothetical protein